MRKNMSDLHTHTIASGHAYNTVTEMARAAAEKGLPILGISDHGPMLPGGPHELYFCNFRAMPDELFGVRMLYGCELNIMDEEGHVDLPERFLSRMHYNIASLHDICIDPMSREANTNAVRNAIKDPRIQILGHPDDAKFALDYEAVALAAKETHTLIELNNASLAPNSSRIGTRENDLVLLSYCKTYRVPIIMNSDAHFMTKIADYAFSEALLREVDFPEELIANYSLEMLKEYIPALRR